MELSLTTFILEIVNFLVLVWILKRLFFVPIKKSIESRRLEIKKSIDDAGATLSVAERLRAQYENRLKDWEKERASKLEELKKELDLERERRLKEVGLDSAKEYARLQSQQEKTRLETQGRQEREAISQSLAFLSKLLSGFASKEVETSIVNSFFGKLANGLLPAKGANPSDAVLIRSAFPLDEGERTRLLAGISRQNEGSLVRFDIDRSLLAGVEITVGSTVLRANLRDELQCFSQVATGGQ